MDVLTDFIVVIISQYYAHQIIMLYTLKLHNVTYINYVTKKDDKISWLVKYSIILYKTLCWFYYNILGKTVLSNFMTKLDLKTHNIKKMDLRIRETKDL